MIYNMIQEYPHQRATILQDFTLISARDINSWVVHIYIPKDDSDGQRLLKAYVSTEEFGASIFTYILSTGQSYEDAANTVCTNISIHQLNQAQEQVAVWRLHGLRLS